MVVMLVGLMLAVVAAAFVTALAAATAAPALAADDGAAVVLPSADEAIPDLVISVPESSTAAEDAASLIDELSRSQAVLWAADDLLSPTAPNIMVSFVDQEGAAGPSAVAAILAERENGAEYQISGRDPSDRLVAERIGLGVFWAVALAAVIGATVVSWLMGLLRGVVTGLVLAASAGFGGTIANSLSGAFDGSLATTAIPAVLAALVTSGYLLLRLFIWFDAPEGDDPADMIRRSVLSVGVELFLLLTGLLVVAVFLELTSPAAAVATAVLVGAVVGALLTLATVPPSLAALRGADEASVEAAADPSRDDGLVSIPSGREFPVAVLAGFGLFLVVVGLFAFRQTSKAEFFDLGVLDSDSAAAAANEALISAGGDPTAAIFATFPEGADQLAKDNWLERVSQLDSVGRVDTSLGRYQDGAFTAVEGLVGSFSEVDQADEAPLYALVVPTAAGRSAETLALVDTVAGLETSDEPTLAGVGVDARSADQRDRSQVWLTMLSLSVVAGVAVFVLIGDLGLAAMTAGLRLVGSAAVVGMYHLLVGNASGTELQAAVLIVALGMGLFELGYFRRLLASHDETDTDLLLDRALNREGAAAAAALGLAAVASLGLLIPDLAMLRRFGILMAVVILIKTVVGMWLLRPAVLGSRAISHFASRPVRAALEALNGTSVTSQAEHKAWTEVINNLLWTEFSFQADPSAADIDSVFVADTALYRKSAEHHVNLQKAGLRIIGRRPQLRALRIVSNSAPATVVATVDHPVRQLTGDSGKVVGVRKAERRSVMLWLEMQRDGSYRIADSVELGAVDLGASDEAASVPVAVPATVD